MRKNGIFHSLEHTSPEIKCQISRSNYPDLMFVEKLSTILRGCSPVLNLSFPDQASEKARWWKATERKTLFSGCNRGLLMKRRPFNF